MFHFYLQRTSARVTWRHIWMIRSWSCLFIACMAYWFCTFLYHPLFLFRLEILNKYVGESEANVRWVLVSAHVNGLLGLYTCLFVWFMAENITHGSALALLYTLRLCCLMNWLLYDWWLQSLTYWYWSHMILQAPYSCVHSSAPVQCSIRALYTVMHQASCFVYLSLIYLNYTCACMKIIIHVHMYWDLSSSIWMSNSAPQWDVCCFHCNAVYILETCLLRPRWMRRSLASTAHFTSSSSTRLMPSVVSVVPWWEGGGGRVCLATGREYCTLVAIAVSLLMRDCCLPRVAALVSMILWSTSFYPRWGVTFVC